MPAQFRYDHQMDFSWRPLTTEDVLPWAGLLDRAERADRVGEHYDLEDIAGQLTEPGLDLDLGTFSAWDGGRMVGYALVRPRTYGQSRPALAYEGVVDPEFRGRGIGGALLGWATTRSAGLPGRAGLRVQASDRVPGYRALLERHGFEPSSWLVDLERPLDAEQQTVAVPDSAVVLARVDSLPGDPVKSCYLDAFGASELDWARLTNAAAYRPDLSFATVDQARGEVEALLLACYFEADATARGAREVYIQGLAARRRARGRGLSEALLAHASAQYKRDGYQRIAVGLVVDRPDADLTGYRQAGFIPVQHWTVYSCP